MLTYILFIFVFNSYCYKLNFLEHVFCSLYNFPFFRFNGGITLWREYNTSDSDQDSNSLSPSYTFTQCTLPLQLEVAPPLDFLGRCSIMFTEIKDRIYVWSCGFESNQFKLLTLVCRFLRSASCFRTSMIRSVSYPASRSSRWLLCSSSCPWAEWDLGLTPTLRTDV